MLNDIRYVNKASRDIEARCTLVQITEENSTSNYVDTADTSSLTPSQAAATKKLLENLSFTMSANKEAPYKIYIYSALGDLSFGDVSQQYTKPDQCTIRYEL